MCHTSGAPGDYRDSASGLTHIKKPGGQTATLLLGTVEVDGKHWAVPHIEHRGGRLVERKPEESATAWGARQVKAGNAIPFDTFEEADVFAKGVRSWKLLDAGDWAELRESLVPAPKKTK